MKHVAARRFCRVLEQRGWVLMRIRGSHRIYAKAGSDIRISVPVHGNAPTAEAQPLMSDADKAPVRLACARRNRDLDPRLVRRGGEYGRR